MSVEGYTGKNADALQITNMLDNLKGLEFKVDFADAAGKKAIQNGELADDTKPKLGKVTQACEICINDLTKIIGKMEPQSVGGRSAKSTVSQCKKAVVEQSRLFEDLANFASMPGDRPVTGQEVQRMTKECEKVIRDAYEAHMIAKSYANYDEVDA